MTGKVRYWLTGPQDAPRKDALPDDGFEQGLIKRFAAPYWTVNFPRPMMASVTTTGPDSLRVDAAFYGSGDLAGLIWEAEDRWDHPLLRYATDRDFRGCVLSFRWQSTGVRALDAVNGPTLTIEGRDASGAPRAWYVRLWNYADGSPTDAVITLNFDAINGGFLIPQEADPVWAGDIDRLFLSIVPTDYDGGNTAYSLAQEAGVTLSALRCDGPGSMLAIGDIIIPEHRVQMATGYDDSYNQTPERVLRQILALGYRGAINHYVGMSHYFRLEAQGEAFFASLSGGAINAPCLAWHRDFAGRAHALGYGIIWSLSYELFAAHCWGDWKQRAANGDPALTGWSPPSTLLSPAHGGAMAYLQAVARAFVAIGRDAGLSPCFQVGEPWWWIMADGRICLSDAAAQAALTARLGRAPSDIADIRASMSPAQQATLDAAGALLAESTAALVAAARAEAPGLISHCLVYLPTVLDDAAPDARRANVPSGWASPAFDVLQIEDYDWVTEGLTARSAAGRTAIAERLGYSVAQQHYLAGFVLNGSDAAMQWPRIAEAAALSIQAGDAATFVWAWPQVARDGFTLFDLTTTETAMDGFDDVAFPLAIGREASVSPTFSTHVIEGLSGHERRSMDWADARLSFDAGPGVRSESDMATLIAFFRARRGAARAFRFTDPFDQVSGVHGIAPSATDQMLGTGDGTQSLFPLIKRYGDGDDAQVRRITCPVASSVIVALNAVMQSEGWTLDAKGIIAFAHPPAAGTVVTAGFRFDVPVRFATDRIDISRASFVAGEAPSVPLIEVRG